MNASALLQAQGWCPGQSLHPHKPSSLRKPLLVSKKVDVLGLGLGRNDSLSDQWWLRAFDAGLKAFGTGGGVSVATRGSAEGDGAGRVGAHGSALGQVRAFGAKRGGLWGRFVKGEGLQGTIGTETLLETSPSASEEEDKSKEQLGVTTGNTKARNSARSRNGRALRTERQNETAEKSRNADESREERRRRKEERARRRVARAERREKRGKRSRGTKPD